MLANRGLLLLLIFAVCAFGRLQDTLAQKVTFGVIAGGSLTDDFRNAAVQGFSGSFSVSNASRAFIIGPKLEIELSNSLSVEVDALHREVRTHDVLFRTTPPLPLPDGGTLTSLTYSSTGTHFAWEFPVLAKYKFSAPKLGPFVEAGPSFRPAENREGYGVTVGTGGD